ncbi:MAG: two-component system, OmpR family, response regulator [Sphingomonadales bacterium]|jgi:DNA-binding response OmpR family regulator|nr:two-component system, OmpR family, response regulator [Sphingomonadales bacterium]
MNDVVTAHIVVVDDDEDVRSTVAEYLRRNGLSVSEADGGAALRELMASRPIDLALLDINMPGDDGLTLAREIRASGDAGIIMLTAKSDDVDRIVGLEIGADDYITKPFNPRELLARVKAVLRRASRGGEAPATMGREVQMGKCRLNLDTRKLFEADGTEVPITAMEFDLLKCFAEHPRRALSRDQLLDLAHSKEMEPFDRSIDTRIARIRRKIERDPAKPSCLKTVRAIGYVFNPDC